MIVLLALVVWAIRIALAVLGAWIVQMNVNDIASYYMQGVPAPFWPFFWIGLFLGLFSASFSVTKS